MASLSFTQFRAEDGSNTKRRIEGIYTGPASYATGGDSFTPAEVKLGQIDVLLFELASNGTLGLPVLYDYANGLVKWFTTLGAGLGGVVEMTAGTDLSAYTARFEAIGR